MKCKGCNTTMTPEEMGRVQPDDKPEELCTKCLIASGVISEDDDHLWDEVMIQDEDDLCS